MNWAERRASCRHWAEVRRRERAAAERQAVTLYPSVSIRDIASYLGVTCNFVQNAARKAGLPPRPVSMEAPQCST